MADRAEMASSRGLHKHVGIGGGLHDLQLPLGGYGSTIGLTARIPPGSYSFGAPAVRLLRNMSNRVQQTSRQRMDDSAPLDTSVLRTAETYDRDDADSATPCSCRLAGAFLRAWGSYNGPRPPVCEHSANTRATHTSAHGSISKNASPSRHIGAVLSLQAVWGRLA